MNFRRPTASDLPVRFVGHVMPSHPARPVTDWMEATRYRPDVKERAYCWPNLTRKEPPPKIVFKQGPAIRFQGWPNLTDKEPLP